MKNIFEILRIKALHPKAKIMVKTTNNKPFLYAIKSVWHNNKSNIIVIELRTR